MPQVRDLSALFAPDSLAVIGASDDERKWGNWLARGALRGEARRKVHLVNRRSKTVLGRPAFASATEIDGGIDLAVVAVPAGAFSAAVDDALAAGARAVIGITAGLAETGPSGALVEAGVVRRVREAGAVMLGPNCLGLFDAAAELHLSSNEFPAGPIGLISQSGNLALELGAKATEAGLGFSRFVSIGNQADLEVADLVSSCVTSDLVELIALYCEDFRDGRRFLEAAEEARAAGKPVVLLTVGTGAAAARAARSHTGALVSGALSIDAACAAAGIERVATPRQMMDLAEGLLAGACPKGRRVGVLADGGGHGAVAADVVEATGLEVPAVSCLLSERLAQVVGTTGGTANPVDLAGAGEQDVWSFERVVAAMVDSDELDSVVVTGYFGDYGAYGAKLASDELEVAAAIGRLVAKSDKPVVFHSMHAIAPDSPDSLGALRILRRAGVPVYPTIEQAAWVLAALVRRATAPGFSLPPKRTPQPGPETGGYLAAKALLSQVGIDFASSRRALDRDELEAAAAAVGFPVALKAVELEHKSDAGGVVLGILDWPALESSAATFWQRFGPGALAVEQMIDTAAGVELLVGARSDPRFGPVVVIGLGGIYAEVMGDIAAALAPVDVATAERLVSSLRGAGLLTGSRGRPALDLAAAARVVAQLSEVAASHPDVAEIEINPLLVLPTGAIGLDARLVLQAGTHTAPGGS